MTGTLDRLAVVGWCARCGRSVTAGTALRVRNRADPSRSWYVCRPGLDGRCFSIAVGPADVHGIAAASDELGEAT